MPCRGSLPQRLTHLPAHYKLAGMGKETGISWTNHTFNPWHGCFKVSPGCDNCYAERTDKRFGVPHWGKEAPRKFMSDHYWAQPLKWDREAAAAGKRARVFCASMADVFEDREDLIPHRLRLWQLIRDTPNLDWLLLTKRPENFAMFLPWGAFPTNARDLLPYPNVWLGVTAEDSERAALRIPVLRDTRAAVRFVSCEPIIECITAGIWDVTLGPNERLGFVHWLIIGDESGHNVRPAQPEWIRIAREAAQRHSIAFHFKQWAGRDADGIEHEFGDERNNRKIHLPILDGKRWAEFPR
jgi:protein gp37